MSEAMKSEMKIGDAVPSQQRRDTKTSLGDAESGIKLEVSPSRSKYRKSSYGFKSVIGIKKIDRTSQLAMEFKRPLHVYLPTYQLGPAYPFNIGQVKAIVHDVLDKHYTDHKYSSSDSPTIAIRMASEIMRKVKNLSFSRYRVISTVTIGQKRAQSYNNAIAMLWDADRDSYVDVKRDDNITAFIQVTVVGIYLD